MSASSGLPQISNGHGGHYRPTRSSSSMSPSSRLNMPTSNTSRLDDVVSRLRHLTLPSQRVSSLTAPRISALIAHPDSSLGYPMTHADCTLDAPFSMSYVNPSKDFDEDVPTIIDTFAPRSLALDLSPTSSTSSDMASTSSHTPSSRSSFDAFFTTRSRVVCVCVLHRVVQMIYS